MTNEVVEFVIPPLANHVGARVVVQGGVMHIPDRWREEGRDLAHDEWLNSTIVLSWWMGRSGFHTACFDFFPVTFGPVTFLL